MPARASDAQLRFWFSTPATTAARPLRFAVVRLDAQGRLLAPGTIEVVAKPGSIEAEPVEPKDSPVRVFLLLPPASHVGPVLLEATSGSAYAEARLQLTDPSATRLSLVVEPPALTKVPGATALVRVEVPPEIVTAPVVVTNIGSVEPLRKVGPGSFETTYRPGEKRFPEVAILSAFLPVPDAGSPAFSLAQVTLPLAAAIDLPGKTRPRVQMSVQIAGETFGPVPSDARGRFLVPVVVPPGHGMARGVSIDRLGNRRVTPIDLYLPPTNRIAVTAQPRILVADGRSRAQIVVTVTDVFGRPRSGERPRLGATRGQIGEVAPSAGAPGVYRAFYTAPREVGAGVDQVKVGLRRDRASHAEIRLTLIPDAPTHAKVVVHPGVIATPSEEAAQVELALRDRFDNPVTEARTELHAGRGQIEAGSALTRHYFPPADASGWEDPIEVQVFAPPGEQAVAAAIDADGGRLLLLDVGGRPVPGVAFELSPQIADAAGSRGPGMVTDESGAVALPEAGRISLRWAGRTEPFVLHQARDPGGHLWGFPGHPGAVAVHTKIVLMEPEPVRLWIDVKAMGDAQAEVRWSVNDAAGDRRVLLRAGRGQRQQQTGRGGRWKVEAATGTLISVTDLETGVMSVMEVPAP